MSLLQTVTSLLLLHFNRSLLIRSRGSSSILYKKMGRISFPNACDRFLQTSLFTVTTVTNKNKNILKTATGKENSFVTAPIKTPLAVTLLLQTVTICNINCHKLCNKIINCISVIYKNCDSNTQKNLYLRISHHQFKNYSYYGHQS